jgi:O-antigen/teichoic acid export membrane protein
LPIANNVLNAGAKYVRAAINIGIALIANIVISIYLTPTIGEMAPAFGLLAGGTIALIMHLIMIHRTIDKISWWPAVIKPYTSVGLAVIVTWNLKQFGGTGLAVGLVCLLSCFAGWKMFTREEMGYFVKLIPWLQRT